MIAMANQKLIVKDTRKTFDIAISLNENHAYGLIEYRLAQEQGQMGYFDISAPLNLPNEMLD